MVVFLMGCVGMWEDLLMSQFAKWRYYSYLPSWDLSTKGDNIGKVLIIVGTVNVKKMLDISSLLFKRQNFF